MQNGSLQKRQPPAHLCSPACLSSILERMSLAAQHDRQHDGDGGADDEHQGQQAELPLAQVALQLLGGHQVGGTGLDVLSRLGDLQGGEVGAAGRGRESKSPGTAGTAGRP